MSKLQKIAAAVPFAHLLSRARAESEGTDETDKEDEELQAKRAEWSKKAESDDERKQGDGESDGEYIKRMEAMDEEEEKEAAEHEEPDGDEGMEDESDDAKAVRASERARCARIISHGIANGCINQAAVFAFDTGLTSKQAKAALNAARADGGRRSAGLGSRMAGVQVPVVGASAPARHDPSSPGASAKAMAEQVIAAAAKARGETA